MERQREKLLHFTEAVMQSAKEEQEALRRQMEQERREALDRAKEEAKEAAISFYDHEAAAIRAESGREVSRHLMDIKRTVYLRRQEIGREVFAQVERRLQEFTAAPEYLDYLKQLLGRAMEELSGADEISLRLRKEDLHFGQQLADAIAPVKVEVCQGIFSRGGLAIRCPQLGLRVDCSFDQRLRELSGHFAESFGLSLSDELAEV